MKRSNLTLCVLLMLCTHLLAQKELAKPSQKQINFADWEVGAFLCFDVITYSGEEHGDGITAQPWMFNPTDIDVEQWVTTAKAMGARYAMLTARHEGGFCLWPTKTTDYSIASSPYKDGKGDIVREYVEACRKHDIKVGLYHTAAFDANMHLRDFDGIDQFDLPLDWMTTWGAAQSAARKADPTLTARVKKKQVEQMRELLTNYGQVDFVWSDHWDATDPDGVWRAVTDLANELQPNLVFMGPDTWVPGNETGHVVYPMWNAVNTKDGTVYSRPAANANEDKTTANNYGLLEGEVRTGHPWGKFWRVRECTTNSGFHYGGWFWHPDSIKPTYPRKHWEHLDLYYRTVGLGANTIINLPIDQRGRIPEDIVEAATKMGDAIRERFSNPIAETKKVIVDDVVELHWRKPKEINTIVTMENIANGQRVVRYTLEAMVDGQWQALVPKNKLIGFKPYNNNPGFQTIGHKKIDRVAPVVTNRIRFRSLENVTGTTEMRYMAVYNNPPIIREYDAGYPYLSGVDTEEESAHHGVNRDENYRGQPIVLDGKNYDYGLMVCPVGHDKKGNVIINLEHYPKAKGFTATIGIEDMVLERGSSEFIVEALVNNQWQRLYKSEVKTGASPAEKIRVNFPQGSQKINLITTVGGDNANADHSIWANAQFFE